MNNNRYSRHLAVEGFEPRHQAMLTGATAVIVGCGALGSQTALYLAGAGVGHIVLIDYDVVDISNLHRQVAYRTDDVGLSKARTLAAALGRLNPDVRVTVLERRINAPDDLAVCVAENHGDIVVEATDNACSKITVCDGAHNAGVPCVTGGVSGWHGQVMTLKTVRYGDIFGDTSADIAPGTIRGVIGPVAGFVAALQATEVIKILTHQGIPLADRMLAIDGLTMTVRTMDFVF